MASSAMRTLRSPRASARGVVLVIALILLVVIGLSSALAIRTALYGDVIASNVRAQGLAMQAAEMALRHCEEQARQVAQNTPPEKFILQSVANIDDAIQWQKRSNWASMANEVPTSVLGSTSYPQPPLCLVEEVELAPPKPGALTERAFQITARGFSPDYEGTNAGSTNGAEVWLQSVLRVFY